MTVVSTPTLHARVDADRLHARLAELVRIPSFTGDEAEAIACVARWLREHEPDEMEHWTASMAELERDPAYPGREVEREAVPVVAARIRGARPGPSLLLTGHVDVVPLGDRRQWTVEPFGAEVGDDGDTLYGRGACDMKSGVVAALEAFSVLAAHRDQLVGDLVFVAVPGEEDGGTGTLAAIRAGWTADMAVVTEPTSRRGERPALVIAHGGALTYTLTLTGRSAHAAQRLDGESALEHYLALHAAMREDERQLNSRETEPVMRALELPYPTSVGRISGGQWSSSVIDQLTVEVRVGVSIHETCAQADARFRAALGRVVGADPWLRAHPPVIERTGAAFESAHLDAAHPLVDRVRRAARAEHGVPPRLAGAPYGCDMAAWIRVGGVPTVVYGPGDIRVGHAPDEHVSLRETVQVARTLVRLATSEPPRG